MEDKEFQRTIIEAVRDFREEMSFNMQNLRNEMGALQSEMRDFKREIRAELRAVNITMHSIMKMLEVQQDAALRQGEKIEGLESRIEKLEDKVKGMEH